MGTLTHPLHPDGEFGPVYQSEDDGIADWQDINESRYQVLKDQLEVYRKAKASWSIWLYKDIGFQGMTYAGKQTAYMKLLKPFLDKKKVKASRWLCDRRSTDGRPAAAPGCRRVGRQRPCRRSSRHL